MELVKNECNKFHELYIFYYVMVITFCGSKRADSETPYYLPCSSPQKNATVARQSLKSAIQTEP